MNDSQKLKYESDNPNDIPYVSSKDIDVDYKTVNYNNGLRIPKEENPLKISPKGSFLLVVEGGSSGRKMVFLEQDVCFVNKLCSFNSVENTKFQYYFIQSSNYQYKFRLSLSGLIGGVSVSNLKDFELTLPPLPEQQQIVSYLDTKTSLIDSLIEKSQRKIKLLKEKRTSLINEVVTKGLNPNVEMKDSGVEWIGEIPSHWVITKVKYVTNLVIDGSHFTPTYTESGIPFLRVTDIHNQIIDLDKVKFISEEEHHSLTKRCQPEKGDLLLSKNGTIGLTKVIDWDWDFSIFVSLCLIKFREVFKPELFSYFFQSSIVDLQIKESSKQSTVTNLHLDKIRELLLIKPTISEQQQIVEYLDEQTQLIDKKISIEEKRIELLKEYCQSLISEVVTGKQKVV